MPEIYDWEYVLRECINVASECEGWADLARKLEMPRKTLREAMEREFGISGYDDLLARAETAGSVSALRKKMEFWQKLAKRYEARLSDRKWLREEVAGLMATLPPVDVPQLKQNTEYHEQVAVLQVSDIHMGLLVPDGQLGIFGTYNSDIAQSRTLYTLSKFGTLAHQQSFPVKRAKIYLLGDIIENSNMRPSQAKQVDAHVVSQTIRAANVLAQGLLDLCGQFEHVEVEAVPGNHGRTTQKAGDNLPDETFDHLVYYIIQKALENQPNFRINIHSAWYFIDSIFGYKFLGLHAEDVLCLDPYTPIVVGDWSTKPINQLLIGETVLGHDGTTCKVTDIHQYHYHGKMVVLSASMMPMPTIRATPNHEVPVVFASQIACSHHDSWTKPNGHCSIQECGHEPITPEIKWVPIEYVSPGDYLVVPVPQPQKTTDKYIISDFLPQLPKELHPREKSIPDVIWANKDLGLIIGQYLADGNCAGKSKKYHHLFHNQVEIVYHEEEEEYWTETMQAYERTFGFPGNFVCRTDMTVRAQRVQFSSRRASTLIGTLAGHGSHTKRLHPSVLEWPVESLRSLLIGYLRGDGHTHRKKYHGRYEHTTDICASTASIDLGWQLFWIARRCGYTPSIKVRNRSGYYEAYIHFYADDARELGPLTQRDHDGFGDSDTRISQRTHCIDCGNFMLVKVINAYQVDYDGPVYDLTVEDRHAYIANGVAVHNSYSGVPFYGIERMVKDYYMMISQVNMDAIRNMPPETEFTVGSLLDMLQAPDYVCIGHFHTPMVWQVMGVEVLANGAMSGVSMYSTKKLRKLTPPRQNMFFVHPEWGTSLRCPISLSNVSS